MWALEQPAQAGRSEGFLLQIPFLEAQPRYTSPGAFRVGKG